MLTIPNSGTSLIENRHLFHSIVRVGTSFLNHILFEFCFHRIITRVYIIAATNFMVRQALSPPLQDEKSIRLLVLAEQDTALLRTLTSPQRLMKFHRVCNDNPLIFGEPKSRLRRQAQNRWRYLQYLRQENVDRFTDLCRSQGIIIAAEQEEASLPQSSTVTLPPSQEPAPAQKTATTSIMSRPPSTAKASLYNEEGDVDEFILNFKRPTANPNGMLVLRSDNLVCDTDMIDCITIIKPLFDARDKSQVKANLFDDGTGFQVFEPSIPTYMVKDLEGMGLLEAEDTFEAAV